MSFISSIGGGFAPQSNPSSSSSSSSSDAASNNSKTQAAPAGSPQAKPEVAETKEAAPPPSKAVAVADKEAKATPVITPVAKPIFVEEAITARLLQTAPVLKEDGLGEARAEAERYRESRMTANILDGLKAQNPSPPAGEKLDMRVPLPESAQLPGAPVDAA